jgi:hypothetical protein
MVESVIVSAPRLSTPGNRVANWPTGYWGRLVAVSPEIDERASPASTSGSSSMRPAGRDVDGAAKAPFAGPHCLA